MNDETIATLGQYITTHILKQPDKSILKDDKLISNGLVDSFHLVDLSIYIEDTFGVRIEDTELNSETFDTLEELARIIFQRQE